MRGAGITWTASLRQILEAVYPPQCALCGLTGLPALCSVCTAEFEAYEGGIEPAHVPSIDEWACLWRYTGRAAQAVQRLKYGRSTSLAAPMATMLAEAAGRWGFMEGAWIVPVPIHWSRRCLRGFNQSELLCERFDRTAVRPELLRRTHATSPQAGLSREARAANLHDAFAAHPEVQGRRIVLVDDVRTSGGTLEACAQALRAAGASAVDALTFASG
ncbi:MAG: ComF family protein [Fimbriimonadaceae bacterium]|nr:ComF family protein [Fimbriimonadaceae bacterium]